MDSPKLFCTVVKRSNIMLHRALRVRKTSITNSLYRTYSSSENPQAQELVVKERIQLTKPSVVKWKRPPFVKNFFVGKFDVELLAFPEILDKEQVFELENTVKVISNILKYKGHSTDVVKPQDISSKTLTDLKELGLFGRLIPQKYGGLELTHTANTRINEVLGLDWPLSCMLAVHEFFTSDVILKFCSEDQKSRFLPKLASGELIGGFCCSESEGGSDLWSMTTEVSKSPDGSFVINGTKAWVTNAGIADVFIVFAKTSGHLIEKQKEISAFLVEKDTAGIEIIPQNKGCLHGLETAIVRFDDVVIPGFNLIGNLGQGIPIYLKGMESFRTAMNSFTFGTLKSFLDSVTDRIIHNERMEKSLGDYQLVRTRLSRIMSMIYAMESVSYFHAAILDSTENPDTNFESAALKIFNSRATLYCLQELIEALGSSSLFSGSQLDKYYRDALALSMFDAPNDVVQLYLGLSGCQYVGQHNEEQILHLRNVFSFPKQAMKEQIRRWRVQVGRIKYDQDIAGHIHPSLVEWGNKLESNILKFEVIIVGLLQAHGKLVSETQIMPRKVADIASELYTWSAVLSRCSRSYCLGLKNSHHELRVASSFCHDSHNRITRNSDDIFLGVANNNERNHLVGGEQVIDCRGYFPEHPLKHNF